MLRGPYNLWFGVVVTVVAAGLLLLPALTPPKSWGLLVLTLATLCGGVRLLIHGHPDYRYYRRKPATFLYWVAPSALALSGALFSTTVLGGEFAYLGLLATGAVVSVLVYFQVVQALPLGDPPPIAHLGANVSIYVSAFLFFVTLQNSGLAFLPRTALLGGLGAALSLELFREGSDHPRREALYAAVVGFLLIELSWSLQLLPLGRVFTGLLLMLAFYLLAGLIHSHLLNRLNHWVVLEFVAVTAVGLGFLYSFQAMGR